MGCKAPCSRELRMYIRSSRLSHNHRRLFSRSTVHGLHSIDFIHTYAYFRSSSLESDGKHLQRRLDALGRGAFGWCRGVFGGSLLRLRTFVFLRSIPADGTHHERCTLTLHRVEELCLVKE